MIKFLNILLLVFIALIVFYGFKIDYKQGLTTPENSPYFYSALVAVVASLFALIVKSFHKLASKNKS